MKWTNESSSIQTVKEKHHSEAFRITGIPKRLRYSPDSSNTFMHKQHQVSGAVLSPASVRAWSLKTSSLATWAVWAATGNSPGTRLLLKQMLAFMNCGISSGLDFAPHFSVNQLCQECLGISVQKLTRNMTQMWNVCWWAEQSAERENGCKMNPIFDVYLRSLRGLVFNVWLLELHPLKSMSSFSSVCRTVIEGAGFAWHFPSTVYEVIVRRTGIKLLFISQMYVRVCEGTCVKRSCRCVILQPPPVVIDNAIDVVYTSSSTCSRSGSAPTRRFVWTC